MTYWYQAYDLIIASEFPLAELEQHSVAEKLTADVFIQQQTIAQDDVVAENSLLRASPEEALFVFPAFGALLVRHGDHILIDPFPGVDEIDFSPFILGAVMSVLLSQRGLTVLHASCVLMGECAVAFVGHKGAGKSVMAASLARRGYPLLADDVTAIAQTNDGSRLIPATAQIRLLPDALDSLGIDIIPLPKVHALSPKRIWRAASMDLPLTIPLRRIYVLTDDEEIGIDRLTPSDSFVELLRHAYLSRWSRLAHQSPDHFQRVSRLATHMPVFRLRRPRCFSAIPALIQLLEQEHV